MLVYRDRKYAVLLFCECVIVLALTGIDECDVYQLDVGRSVWYYNGVAGLGA